MKNYGMSVLVPQLNLNTNADPTITTVSANKMGPYPASDKYTYSFAVYVTGDRDSSKYKNPYLFYRFSDSGKTSYNIGLKIDTSKPDTLYLDYMTTTSTRSEEHTSELQSH